jgi:predicted GNAT superfamily acetyltransferase
MINSQSPLSIRTIQKGDPAFAQVQRLMESTWSQGSLIPVHLTLTFLKNGGLLLGAFEQETLVAFSLGFPGFDGKNPYLCSHMLAVNVELRHRRIGELMKWHQRTEALKMGYTKMVWTYDPLESVNAYLNLTKLGAICRTYLENCYGNMNDELNQGLPSDRFWAEWHLDEPHIATLSESQNRSIPEVDPSKIAATLKQADTLPQISEIDIDSSHSQLWVPLPPRFQQIKKEEPSLAMDWRMQYRTIFQRLFSEGYIADGVYRDPNGEMNYYLLTKGVRS